MARFIIVARSDGRGGMAPFGTYGKGMAGSKVTIGEKVYTVGRDGRVNVPKPIMEQYGVKGTDGRNRVVIEFASKPDTHGATVGAIVSRPSPGDKDRKTGALAGKQDIRSPDHVYLEPYDSYDYNWSP